MDNAAQNTDREIWREKSGDFYSPSVHVTQDGGIGIDVGGMVFVMDVRDWHNLAMKSISDGVTLAPMCDDCGVNRSDPPSLLCPGCQAYREHQR